MPITETVAERNNYNRIKDIYNVLTAKGFSGIKGLAWIALISTGAEVGQRLFNQPELGALVGYASLPVAGFLGWFIKESVNDCDDLDYTGSYD
jgi:hypothetical protein